MLKPAVPPLGGKSMVLSEYTGPRFKEEAEDLEVKLRRILENVPVRISNTSDSSTGSGRRLPPNQRVLFWKTSQEVTYLDPTPDEKKEQDRLTRMDVDYQRRKEEVEFNIRREERLKAAEERTAKKLMKRRKKKQKKREKKTQSSDLGEERHKEESSDNSEESDLETRQ